MSSYSPTRQVDPSDTGWRSKRHLISEDAPNSENHTSSASSDDGALAVQTALQARLVFHARIRADPAAHCKQ
jgi:hypothetical protein